MQTPTLRVNERSFLLSYLFKNLTHLNKTKIKQVLKFGSVSVNGKIITSHRHELYPGDKIHILNQKKALATRLLTSLGFPIVYEDNMYLIVEKPAGLLTIGTDREKKETLYYKLTEFERAKSPDDRGRVFIVHRLDREASGLLVFAKNDTVKRTLQAHWKDSVKKYYAVVEGVPKKKEDVIESYLVEDDFKRVYSTHQESPGAKLAITRYRLVDHNGRYSLLDVKIDTGRKNQIRVQLSDIGYPIAGDAKYGAKTDPLRRLCLHAYSLSFPHPVTSQMRTYKSKLPEAFEVILTPRV